MSILVKEQGKTLEITVSGKLDREDYEHFVPEFERLLEIHGKLRVLFNMLDFHGWKLRALWDDLKFEVRHAGDIDRLAMVGDKKWEKGMSFFCRPFTTAQIRYFDRANAKHAKDWLRSSSL
jgi:hypothetical protein